MFRRGYETYYCDKPRCDVRCGLAEMNNADPSCLDKHCGGLVRYRLKCDRCVHKLLFLTEADCPYSSDYKCSSEKKKSVSPNPYREALQMFIRNSVLYTCGKITGVCVKVVATFKCLGKECEGLYCSDLKCRTCIHRLETIVNGECDFLDTKNCKIG